VGGGSFGGGRLASWQRNWGAAVSTGRLGIARVVHPLESPLSEVYETTFRISIAGCGRARGRFLVAVVRPSGAAQSRDPLPVGGKCPKAAVSTEKPGIARVSYPLESSLSKTYESGVRILVAGRGSPGGRFLTAFASWRRGSGASGLDRGCTDRPRPRCIGKPAAWKLRNDP
jgi:hypothetical protein